MLRFKGCHYQKQILLFCTRWYLADPLSDRHIEEIELPLEFRLSRIV